MPIAVSESTSYRVTREKRTEEENAVAEQRHCSEIMSGQGKDLKSISGYKWWANIYSNN
jgi:hypothetical protein